MKKNIFKILSISMGLIMCLSITGCSKENDVVNNWDTGTFGEIDLNQEVVDTNDFDVEYPINEYIDFSERNETKLNEFTEENFRIYYNRTCEDVELPVLDYVLNKKMFKKTDLYTVYSVAEGVTGVYLYKNNSDKLIQIEVENNISYTQSGIEELDHNAYRKQIAELMPFIYGGVPFMKNYDLHILYEEICSLLNDDKAYYSKTINGVDIKIEREYNWCTLRLSGYNELK